MSRNCQKPELQIKAMKFISKIILKLLGWKLDNNQAPKALFDKSVIICAPHTSNWDYVFALLIMNILGINAKYAIKKEALRFPLGFFIRWMGGIGIDRTPKEAGQERKSTVEAIAELFEQHEQLSVLIAAEGSRSLRKEWKTGFYYIALEAKVPIILGYLNYEIKEGGFGTVFYPSGNVEKDMLEIMQFFSDKKPKNPEQFSLDVRYYNKDNQ
jgi:1-acyl-sn-glycerol-3-phosphate acyltransferase